MTTTTSDERRIFLQKALMAAGITLSASAFASVLAGCETDESQPPVTPGRSFTVDIAAHPELANPGGIVIVPIQGFDNDIPVFVARVDTSTFAVFTTKCTHQGCPVFAPSQPGDDCICSCHSATYDPMSGRVKTQPLGGGSATDLPTWSSTFDATTNILTINS